MTHSSGPDITVKESAEQQAVSIGYDWNDAPMNFAFVDKTGTKVGILTVEADGTLSFEGNTDDSARIFFVAVIEANNLEIKRLQHEVHLLKEKMGYSTGHTPSSEETQNANG